jgi:hypothetical protein
VVEPVTAAITASGPTTFCAGGSVTLTASAGGSYLWSNGATTQSITVSQTGSYWVRVANAGCSATSQPVDVTVNPLPAPTIRVSQQYTALAMASDGLPLMAVAQSTGNTYTFCGTGVTVGLTALPLGNGVRWSTGQTTPQITVTQSGTYTVTMTTAEGCSADASVTILITPYPTPPRRSRSP